MSGPSVVIFANGTIPQLAAAESLVGPDDLIICADGGLRHARSLGLVPHVLIGDLDSLPDEEQTALQSTPAEVISHPRDKDQTDLELALAYALQRDPASILIIGALGGRLDQTLGNISLLSDPRLHGLACRLDDGTEELFFCDGQVSLRGQPGDRVSLIAWRGTASNVQTGGLRWTLRGEQLLSERSRGISNEMLGNEAVVRVGQGAVLVIHTRVLTWAD